MRFEDVVVQWPTLRVATQADNARILEFFDAAPMRTSAFDLQYRRGPDFFRLLRYQADRAFVVISEDEKKTVQGVGSVSLRPGWVDRHPTTIGYLGDLRVKIDRRLGAIWRGLFTQVMARSSEIEELADCSHWFTTVLDQNAGALSALGTARGGVNFHGRRQPVLVPIAPFTMRNLILRLPLVGRARASKRWRIVDARQDERGILQSFFEDQNRAMQLGFRNEFERRLSRWDGLSVTDFVYAADEQGIVACVAPWSPSAAKQTVVSRVPASFRMLGRIAKLFPMVRLRVPRDGEPLRTPYLTHLTFAARLGAEQRGHVLRLMLNHLFNRWEQADWHCVALCDFKQWDLGRALSGFVQEKVPITMYAVIPPGSDGGRDPFNTSSPPAFEMAIV